MLIWAITPHTNILFDSLAVQYIIKAASSNERALVPYFYLALEKQSTVGQCAFK